jgi:hypothetical protein
MSIKYLVVNPYLTEIKDIEARLFKGTVPVNIVQPLGCNYDCYLAEDEADPASFQLSLTSGLLGKFIKEGHIKVVEVNGLGVGVTKLDTKVINPNIEKIEKVEVESKGKQDLNAFIKENNLNTDKIIEYLKNHLSEFMLKSDLDKQLRYAKVRLDGAEIIGDDKEIEFWSQKLNSLTSQMNDINKVVVNKGEIEKVAEKVVEAIGENLKISYDEFKNYKYQQKLNFIKHTTFVGILDSIIANEKSSLLVNTATTRKEQLGEKRG